MDNSFSMKSNGNVAPAVFVRPDTSDANLAVAAAATELTCGISGMDTRQPPYGSLDDGYHAIAAETILVHGPGSRPVKLSIIGTVTAGDFIKPSTGGKGITTTTDKDYYGARALESGVSGDMIEVEVIQGYLSV